MSLPAGAVIAAMEHLPVLRFEDVRPRGLVVVAPHPDDESLGCGGLIGAARAAGVPVRIVVVSDGTGSHPNSRLYPAERLRSLREAEAREAAAALGVEPDQVVFLQLPDRFVPSAGPAAEAATLRIAGVAREVGADMMTVSWTHDPHCDHEAAFALALAACRTLPATRLYAYPVWGLTLPEDARLDTATPRGFRLRVADRDAKRRAIMAHRSQTSRLIDDDPEGFVLTADHLARFDRDHEIFMEVAL